MNSALQYEDTFLTEKLSGVCGRGAVDDGGDANCLHPSAGGDNQPHFLTISREDEEAGVT